MKRLERNGGRYQSQLRGVTQNIYSASSIKRLMNLKLLGRIKKALEVKVTRYIHAETFRKLNATHIGQKLICSGDEAVTEEFNPKIKLT
jgi:hypothetical protein